MTGLPTPLAPSVFDKVIQLDEDGYFGTDGLRIANSEEGAELLQNMRVDASGRLLTTQMGAIVLVENFDEPLIVKRLELGENGQASFTATYGYEDTFALETLRLDEWDRFKGRTLKGLPFVFSTDAQDEFFNSVDAFDDDGFEFGGVTYATPAWFSRDDRAGTADFWTSKYRE